MAIRGNSKTRLTNSSEKLFVKLGGGDPNRCLTKSELTHAAVKAIDVIHEQRPAYLETLFNRIMKQVPHEEQQRISDLAKTEIEGA